MGLERYESKHVLIKHPAERIYTTLSDFSNFTPILADKVDGWQASDCRCDFKVKGFNVGLEMVEREAPKLIKIRGAEGSPMDFTFWLQMVEAKDCAGAHTHMRIVLQVELNMMMKMMVGGKLQEAADQIAQQIADSLNRTAQS